VGVDPERLLRLPLTCSFPTAAAWNCPTCRRRWMRCWALRAPRGWHWRDKLALLRTATGWQLAAFAAMPQTSVGAASCAKALPPTA
jgi:hypothetical protein